MTDIVAISVVKVHLGEEVQFPQKRIGRADVQEHLASGRVAKFPYTDGEPPQYGSKHRRQGGLLLQRRDSEVLHQGQADEAIPRAIARLQGQLSLLPFIVADPGAPGRQLHPDDKRQGRIVRRGLLQEEVARRHLHVAKLLIAPPFRYIHNLGFARAANNFLLFVSEVAVESVEERQQHPKGEQRGEHVVKREVIGVVARGNFVVATRQLSRPRLARADIGPVLIDILIDNVEIELPPAERVLHYRRRFDGAERLTARGEALW